MLKAHPDAKLRVFALWVDTMPADARSAWPYGMFGDDPRVTSLWDASDRVGRWIGAHRIGGLGGRAIPLVWDAYLAYGAGAEWADAPTEPLAAGSTIIENLQPLEGDFLPLLG